MRQDIEYRKENNEIIVQKYNGTSSKIEIPSAIDGLPVTEIADYAFHNCRSVQKIIIPDSITTIGNHAFYDCRKLESMVASDAINSIGDGAFKNCYLLKSIEINLRNGKIAVVRNILSEFSSELTVTLHYAQNAYEKGKTAKIIFPKFLYDYVENNSARIIRQETYGSGVHYRECMTDHDIDYKKYDSIFHVGMAVDMLDTTLFIALYRIMYPYQLTNTAKENYGNFIREHFDVLMKLLVEDEMRNEILCLIEENIISLEQLDNLMEYARRQQKLELVSYFLSYKQRNYLKKSMTFDL
ncbi:leucine-rich repeat domain-containing protein [Lachnoclostridium sp.]|uniref:leucine-rich repeat domain-containing protein n=1 Tax=Lachnoclostridium sp. TaxID=2028282 RepID=UPI00289DECFF|nr:leucine-rich repeat domain-containing protein [Lachnoclostridium sp.]